jgi:hypothetical protein
MKNFPGHLTDPLGIGLINSFILQEFGGLAEGMKILQYKPFL